MDVDSVSKPAGGKQARSKRIEKRGRSKSSIVFTKFKDRKGHKKKA